MNDKPFSYISSHGTTFTAERCDFRGGVSVANVSTYPDSDRDIVALYSCDLAEMIGYHATNIWPELNGFQGYDCIKFIFPEESKCKCRFCDQVEVDSGDLCPMCENQN